MKTLIAAAAFAVSLPAQADTQACSPSRELTSLLDCSYTAMAALPEEKRARLSDEFVHTALLIGGEPLALSWASRLGVASLEAAAKQVYPDYGWQTARPLIAEGGLTRLVSAARTKSEPLRFGRSEALLAVGTYAAGYKLDGVAADDLVLAPAAAFELNRELLSLARTAGEFEQGDLAFAAAKLAAYRCDLDMFDEARPLLMEPDAIRYKFWRARITGDRSGLTSAIMLGATAADTSHVRQTLEGLEMLADIGDCPRS